MTPRFVAGILAAVFMVLTPLVMFNYYPKVRRKISAGGIPLGDRPSASRVQWHVARSGFFT